MRTWQSLLIFLLCLTVLGCAKTPPPSVAAIPSPTPTMSVEDEEDQLALSLLQDKEHIQPALAWLANSKDHLLWKGNRAIIQAYFHELEQAGVKEIWAFTQTYQDKQIAAAYVVVLPPPGEARKATFRLHNRFWASQIEDREKLEVVRRKDEGQKYLTYSFD